MGKPEYLTFRCCMCPNRNTPSSRICPSGGPENKLQTFCRFVKSYVDSRGWKYRVMSGTGGDNYKARYQRADKHGSDGWHGVTNLPRRNTFDDAQRDLNALAEKRGWREYEAH